MVVSVYLWTGEGLTDRNVAIIERALGVARSHGSLWMIGGDFNITPDLLQHQLDRLLAKAGAVVRAPTEATHYPGRGAPAVLDYFILDERLDVGFKGIRVNTELALKPHRVVELDIDVGAISGLVSVVRKPKPFSRHRPQGCARQPTVPEDKYVTPHGDEACDIGQLWSAIANSVEHELCGLLDHVDAAGRPRKEYCGRGQPLQVVRRPVLPPRICGPVGRVDRLAHAMRWALVRVEELYHLAAKAHCGLGLAPAALLQWAKLQGLFCRRTGLVKELAAHDAVFVAYIDDVSAFQLGDPPASLRTIMEMLTKHLEERRTAFAKVRGESWSAYVAQQVKLGGGALHRYAKRAADPIDMIMHTEFGPSAWPQDKVDAAAREWRTVWHRLRTDATAPWRIEDCDDGWVLPSITVADIRRAARSFRTYTGFGVDHLPPHLYGWLSDDLLGVIAVFLNTCEEKGSWPDSLAVLMVHLIPKASGGLRPIVLLASILRIWERVRVHLARQWRDRCQRQWDWARAGRSAERAVWTQTTHDEAAMQRGLQSGSTLMDLRKAFEHVPLERAWRGGKRHGYPLRLLRSILECSAFARRLTLLGAVSDEIFTLTAVAAGLTFATDLLQLAIMDTIDTLCIDHPAVRVCVYIDDITLHRVGTEHEVAADLAAATRQCIDGLERCCNLVVDRELPWQRTGRRKSIAVGSSAGLRRQLATSLGALGITVKKKAKHLGVDYKPGAKRAANAAQATRWAHALRKRPRVKTMGPVGGAHVMNTGLVPALRYGATTTGIGEASLRKAAAAASEIYGSTLGRSTTARLALRRTDPRPSLVLRPISAWVEAVWCGTLPMDLMSDAFRYAQKTVGLSKRPHQEVCGGAGAYVAALRRLRWRAPSATTILTLDGDLIDLCVTEPRTVIEYAVADLETIAAARSSVALDFIDYTGTRGMHRCRACRQPDGTITEEVIGQREGDMKAMDIWRRGRFRHLDGRPVPWFLPGAAFLARGSPGGVWSSAKASVAALIEGGWWPQSRLAAVGAAATDTCQACMQRTGTLYHRLGECCAPEAAEHRSSSCPPWLQRQASTLLWNPLFARGVPAEPKRPPHPPEVQGWSALGQPAAGCIATGDIFTDGAMSSIFGMARRAGWGVAAVDGDGNELWSMHGTLAERFPTVVRAELRAVLEALRRGVAPLRIHTDSQEVVDGFTRGEGWSTSPCRSGASTWRQIWPILRDLQASGDVIIVKVKGHTCAEDIAAGRTTKVEHLGNGLADKAARAGSSAAEKLSPTVSFRRELACAIRWYQWVAAFTAAWPSDTTDYDGEAAAAARRVAPEPGRRAARANFLTHVRWRLPRKQVCRRCGREAADGPGMRDLRNTPCLGSAAGRVLRRTGLQEAGVADHFAIAVDALVMKGASPIDHDPGVDPPLDAGIGDDECDPHGEACSEAEPGDEQDAMCAQGFVPEEVGGWHDTHDGMDADDLDVFGFGGSLDEPFTAPPPPPPGPPVSMRAPGSDAAATGMGARDAEAMQLAAGAAARCQAPGSSTDHIQLEADSAGRGGAAKRAATTYIAAVDAKRGRGAASTGPAGRRGELQTEGDLEHLQSAAGGSGRGGAAKRPTTAHTAAAGAKRARGGAGGVAGGGTAVEARGLGEPQPAGALSRDGRVQGDWGHGHRIAVRAGLAWCDLCGRYAAQRVAAGLARPCPGSARGAYAARLRRLREGLHPLTGISLD